MQHATETHVIMISLHCCDPCSGPVSWCQSEMMTWEHCWSSLISANLWSDISYEPETAVLSMTDMKIWSNNVVDCQLGKYLISEEWRRAPVSSPVSPMSAPLQSLQCCDHCPLLFSSSSSATIVTVTYSHLSIADQTDFSEEHFNDREQMTSVQSQMWSFIHHENVTQTQNNLINTTQPWKKIFWWNSWKYYFYPK